MLISEDPELVAYLKAHPKFKNVRKYLLDEKSALKGINQVLKQQKKDENKKEEKEEEN